jgi:hypothetical protein
MCTAIYIALHIALRRQAIVQWFNNYNIVCIFEPEMFADKCVPINAKSNIKSWD